MKNFITLFTNYLSGALALLLLLVFVCSCKTTVKNTPTRAESLTESNQVSFEKPKSRFKYNKKPGDAVADFQKDHRNGALKLKQYGAPGAITPYYNKLLTEELGIRIEVIGDGIMPPEWLRYAKQYNALMTAEIQKKYAQAFFLKPKEEQEFFTKRFKKAV